MLKLVAIGIIAFILVIWGGCSMVRCACGKSKGGYVWKCAKQGCKGEKFTDSQKSGGDT